MLNIANSLKKLYLKFIIRSKRLVLPGFDGVPLYDVGIFFFKGLKNGAIITRGSAVAFNFFLAIFPAIIFVFSLIPYIPYSNFPETILDIIRDVLPGNAYLAAKATLRDILRHERTGLLSLGFILAIFFATNGLAGIMTSFNDTFHTIETRSVIKQRFVAVLMVFLLSVVVIIAIALIITGKNFFLYLLDHGYLKSSITMNMIRFVRWIVVLLVFYIGISFLYYYAPSRKQKFRFFTAGATFATILSLVVSVIFKFWFNNFVKFNVLFGSIGSLMVILLWIYFMAIIILIGFELNASIKNANLQNHLNEHNADTKQSRINH